MKDINKFTNELFNSSGLSVNPSHDIHDLCKEIKINGDALDPPPLNWSTPIVRKRRIRYGNQETQTRRDCNEAKAG